MWLRRTALCFLNDFLLHLFKGISVDDRLVNILEDHPVFLRIITASLVFEGLGIGLKIDDITAILLLRKNFADGAVFPPIRIRLRFLSAPADPFFVPVCELGYWLGKPFWGRGYMPEAAREIIRHGFEDLGMKTIWCGYYDGNQKSKRVQEKLGFVYHHTCPDVPVPLMNEVRVGHTNVMTREHWERSVSRE